MGEPRPLDLMREQIVEAWGELLMARMDWARSPNADTIRAAVYAEARVNRLLERLWAGMSERQQHEASARPVQMLTAA